MSALFPWEDKRWPITYPFAVVALDTVYDEAAGTEYTFQEAHTFTDRQELVAFLNTKCPVAPA